MIAAKVMVLSRFYQTETSTYLSKTLKVLERNAAKCRFYRREAKSINSAQKSQFNPEIILFV